MITIKQNLSAFFNDRPNNMLVDTLIIHSMYHPDVEDSFSATQCKNCLDMHEVSSHYIIDRDGVVFLLVDPNKRAWHAGKSAMPNDERENVNDFSIGIELISNESSGYTQIQLDSLETLSKELIEKFNIKNIFGHNHIAPIRKTDPWAFDWSTFKDKFTGLNLNIGQ